ncbi:S4 domain-containing protein, partial [Caldibacillus debilis]|uniref:S4 domain-containing protein n=1 Tax=Caldibacillus debilis TaxID=301148 RepID=UPI0023F0C491
LFSGYLKKLTADEVKQGFKDVPSYTLTEPEIPLVDLLVQANISPSKRQAREDIANGAIYINGDRITDLQYTVSGKDKIENQFIIIRRGKKKYFLIRA